LIEACLHVKGLSSDVTFKECYDKFGVSLRVVATDLNEAIAINYSPKDTPNYKVADAVRASMSFPYYFQPHICPVSGHYLADGGVISNYPLFVLPKEEHSKTLSILINSKIHKMMNLMDEDVDKIIVRPIQMTLIEKHNLEMKFYSSKCIEIPLKDINILDFSLSEEAKYKIIETGRESVIEYFKNCPKPVRRYSVG
jgi:NTE family protein